MSVTQTFSKALTRMFWFSLHFAQHNFVSAFAVSFGAHLPLHFISQLIFPSRLSHFLAIAYPSTQNALNKYTYKVQQCSKPEKNNWNGQNKSTAHFQLANVENILFIFCEPRQKKSSSSINVCEAKSHSIATSTVYTHNKPNKQAKNVKRAKMAHIQQQLRTVCMCYCYMR